MKLDLGCGDRKRDGYEGVDYVAGEGVDHVCDLTKPLPFSDNSVEAISTSHFLEHLTDKEVLALLRECLRILIPGGELEVVVPNFPAILEQFKAAEWAEKWTWTIHLIFGGQDGPGMFHKTAFDLAKIAGAIEYVGFTLMEEDEVWTHQQSSLRVVARK